MIEIINTEPTLLEKIQQISKHYSPEQQIEKAKEALRELLAELEAAEIINGKLVLPDNIWSEAADVIIMNIQLAMQHGKENKVRKQLEYKVNRQLRRMSEEGKTE
mgnify:CR=1 FL=1